MTDDPDFLDLIEAGVQAEAFLGGELSSRLSERAAREVHGFVIDIINTPIELPPDDYKTRVVALVQEINRRENAFHWINDVYQEYIAYEEAAQTQEPLDDG